MTGSIQERDLLALAGNAVRADMLGDSSRLGRGNVRIPYLIEQ